MLRNLRYRRRPRHGVFLCVVVSCLILLVCLTLSLLHIRVTPSSRAVNYDFLTSDSGIDDAFASYDTVDTIDALDVVEEQSLDAPDGGEDDDEPLDQDTNTVSGFFFHHGDGVIRRAFNKMSMDLEEEQVVMGIEEEDRSMTAFGSDDVAVDERVRLKEIELKGVEDALLLNKVSPLREGWGDWFDKKSDFLRKDKMLRSNLEGLNPFRNPILQDPDAVGLTGITKADKIIRNSILQQFKNLPFPSRKIIQQPNL